MSGPEFKVWKHPKSEETRVYLNGLFGQRTKVFWAPSDLAGPQIDPYRNDDQTLQAVSATVEALKAAGFFHMPYAEALQRATYPLSTPPQHPALAPTPPAPKDPMPAYLASLQQSLIVHLLPAARAAGVQFRNGLSKDEIIQRVIEAGPDCARRTLEVIAQLKQGQPIKKTPAVVDPDAGDWDAPIPTPKGQPQPSWSAPKAQPEQAQPAPQAIDLSAYLKREEWARIRASDSAARDAEVSNIKGEIEALRALRPVVIQFPEKPEPIKLEGSEHPQFADLLLVLRAGLHAMLVGPAGSGKTFAAEQAAGKLDRPFFMQGAVSYAHELLGYVDAHSRYVRTQFRDAFENGGLILLDEFDASAAEAALVLNAALANGACAFPDGLVRKHERFLCVVGANTDGSGATMQYAGRARLDGAFLDRFVVFDWQIDSRIEERLSRGNSEWLEAVRAVREFAHKKQILDVVATPRAVMFGSLLQSQGMSRALVLARTCKRGALVECWTDVERIPAVAAFLRG